MAVSRYLDVIADRVEDALVIIRGSGPVGRGWERRAFVPRPLPSALPGLVPQMCLAVPLFLARGSSRHDCAYATDLMVGYT